MFATLALFAAIALEGSTFPTQPIAIQVEAGAGLARRGPGLSLNDLRTSPESRAAFSNIWGSSRQSIGTWSNGHQKVAVEHALWVSPELVSRWLGFLDQREYWEDGELQKRWDTITTELNGKKTFIISLSAYPKMPFRGIGSYSRPDPEEIKNVRFVYTSGDKAKRMSAVRIAAWQSRDRKNLDGFAWWHLTDFGAPLIGEFEEENMTAPLPLGDYHRSWYLVTTEDVPDEKFEIRVLSKRKERVASFRDKIDVKSRLTPVKVKASAQNLPNKKTSPSRGNHRHGMLQQGLVNGLCGKYCDK